ncbi:putative ankyrin repeat protein RF_0381 [Latimeria chalumnae]|uniref:putative ankyrin repeat protein RF_0381 n=1 Tax=Latimeria chalumnae TaxID=7897 RepID=UPI0003C127A1|nr:PREDICTED: putative ankyrin repeat protein RF_0381 [Latimeria chalumnae]|eukprot:XP_005996067.1 PREDICTED: putative ankyrin repeat protein RF_0381 [Latimeria chalumnae]
MHVVSYGEPGKEVALDCLRFLLSYKVSIRKRNKKGLLPIHCAAIQGRIDVIQLLLQSDSDGEMEKRTMEDRANGNTPSMLYLALMNSHLKCAKWLAEQSFSFKPEEPEELMFGLVQDEVATKEKLQTLEFLVNHGVNINAVNNSGDSVLHLAAFRPDLSEVLALLLTKGAKVNEENGEHCTPLFCAVLASNMHAANLLIKHGANIRQKNDYGLTAFDYIGNYEEWIGSGLFSGSVTELLKAHDLKQSRSLVQQISRKLKTEEASKQFCSAYNHQNQISLSLPSFWVDFSS